MKANKFLQLLLLQNMTRTTRSMATNARRGSTVTIVHKIKGNSPSPRTPKLNASTSGIAEPKSSKKRKKANSPNEGKGNEVVEEHTVERTQSFQPLSYLTFNPDSEMKIHTLILGTHPSIKSLAESQYFGHPLNTFWWIAGDNLGFRRGSGVSPSSGKPYQLTKDLLYSNDYIIPYNEQIERLASNGFALWDVLQSCKRKGSLDADIKEEQPNKIREFCNDHPSIKRIVLCNGSSSAVFFNRYFKHWWLSGQLKPGSNKESIAAFGKYETMRKKQSGKQNGNDECDGVEEYPDEKRIECICGIGVSPAAAKYTYVEKRDFYKEFCYDPGLRDHKLLNS